MKNINLILTAILTVAMSYVIAELFWRVTTPEPKSLAIIKTPKATLDNLRMASNIFGSKKTFKKAPPKPEPKNIKLTPLNLDLIGVLFKDSDKSLAMIAPSGSLKSKVYRVGDSVKTDAIVKEIKISSVVFQRGKQTEELFFKKPKKDHDILGKQIKSNKKSRSSKKRGARQAKLSTIQRNTLNDYRAEIVNNPRQLLSIVSVLPFFRNGKMIGVKVRPNKNRAIFDALGFKSGDIIVKINSVDIDSFDKFAKLRQMIYSEHRFNLEIKRNNKNIDLFIQL